MQNNSDYYQARVLRFLKSSRKPVSEDEIESLCNSYTYGVLFRLNRLGLIIEDNGIITLSDQGQKLLARYTPQKALQAAESKPFAGLRIQHCEISLQEWFRCFEFGRFRLRPRSIVYEDFAESNEAKRFWGQFIMQPDLAEARDNLIFQTEEVAKALSTFIDYVSEAAQAAGVNVQNIPFLQPLQLATLSCELPFLGVAFSSDGVVSGESRWYFFSPPIGPANVNESPSVVMKYFTAYLNKFIRGTWSCFILPWDIFLALRNNKYLCDFYKLKNQECSAAIDEVLCLEKLSLARENAEHMLLSLRPGKRHWKEYQDGCLSILHGLFCPPLGPPREQGATSDGLEIRDALFPNAVAKGPWRRIREKVPHKFVLFEFKNWSRRLDKSAIVQVRQYLSRKSIGKLGIIISRTGSSFNAKKAQDNAYRDDDAVILSLSDRQLLDMVALKEIGHDPATYIEELVDHFLATF